MVADQHLIAFCRAESLALSLDFTNREQQYKTVVYAVCWGQFFRLAYS